MSIGERIKRRREELGLTVDDVARQLGKHRSTVYRYENNEIENLPTDVLEPLAIVLQTTPASLLGWDSEFIAYISEESKSGRAAAKKEMYRTFGTDYGASDLEVIGDKLVLLYYKAMDRCRTLELSGIISDVEDLSLREMANVRDILRAYLRADASRKEIVDFALKPYMGTPPSEESDICAEF